MWEAARSMMHTQTQQPKADSASGSKSAQHSPLPWHVCTLGETPFHTSNIVTNDGHLICNVQSTPYKTTGKADAKLIVRCVNNAEKLAEALRHVVDSVDGAWGTPSDASVNHCRAALADWEAAQ